MKENNSEILERIETRLAALERKIDALSPSSSRPMERSSFAPKNYGDKAKMTYKAVCAQCGQSCGVPFKPVGDRPVFCSECFARQQQEEGDGESKFHKKPRDFRKPAPGGKKPFFKKKNFSR